MAAGCRDDATALQFRVRAGKMSAFSQRWRGRSAVLDFQGPGWRNRHLLGSGEGSSAVRARPARIFAGGGPLHSVPYGPPRSAASPGIHQQLSAPQRGSQQTMSGPAEGAGKPVRESVSEYAELALPTDANGLGNVLGGKVMHLVDLAGAMAALRHARKPVVTAAVDSLHFLHPVRIGQLIILRSSVNRVFRTSMEVGVYV